MKETQHKSNYVFLNIYVLKVPRLEFFGFSRGYKNSSLISSFAYALWVYAWFIPKIDNL